MEADSSAIIAATTAAASLLLFLVMKKKKKRTRSKKRIWIRPWVSRRPSKGFHSNLLEELRIEDKNCYRTYLRMDESTYNYILTKITPLIIKQATHLRNPISPNDRLLATLRYLATGETYSSLQFTTRIPQCTLSAIIPDTCKAIYQALKETHLKIGGLLRKPSARKSIHSHCSRCNTVMGRYGAVHHRSELNIPTANQEQGQDEVDNVMSKMVRPASPVPVRNNRMCRRNSYDVNNEFSDDDSEEDNMLSKSSPPAFSLYSDELYASANATFQQNELHNSRNGSHQQNSPKHQRMNNSTNRQNQSISKNINKKEESSLTQLLIQILLVCLVACFAVFFIQYYPSEPTKMNGIYDKISFYNDVMDLGEKYKVKDTSILQVRTGVATIFEKQDTGSFIFAYNSNNQNFNTMKFNSFVEDLAAAASRYLRNKSVHHNTVVVDTVNLKMQTEKEFMNKYEAGVAQTGVMLVKDMDNVPPQLAMAFHYYCDEYSPLVRGSAIFFTLNLAKCSNNSNPKSTHRYIEKCLAKKWSGVGEDRIGPLLTRVVNIVVDVTSVV